MKRSLPTAFLVLAVAFLALAAVDVTELDRLHPVPPPLDAELGVPVGQPLESMTTKRAPALDGTVEPLWEQARALEVQLHYGLHGSEEAGTVELRSLHDASQVYFLARWRAEVPGGDPDAWRNLMTVHWRLRDPGEVSGDSSGSDGLACTVGCHTATVDGQGNLVGIRTETIPPGLSEYLPAGGGWSPAEWLFEWSRPKQSESPYDQDLDDPDAAYPFFVKLFLGIDGKPDPVSDVHELRLRR